MHVDVLEHVKQADAQGKHIPEDVDPKYPTGQVDTQMPFINNPFEQELQVTTPLLVSRQDKQLEGQGKQDVF